MCYMWWLQSGRIFVIIHTTFFLIRSLNRFNGECTKCNAGTFNDMESQITCRNCPAGTYSNKGAVACQNCDPGTYSN